MNVRGKLVDLLQLSFTASAGVNLHALGGLARVGENHTLVKAVNVCRELVDLLQLSFTASAGVNLHALGGLARVGENHTLVKAVNVRGEFVKRFQLGCATLDTGEVLQALGRLCGLEQRRTLVPSVININHVAASTFLFVLGAVVELFFTVGVLGELGDFLGSGFSAIKAGVELGAKREVCGGGGFLSLIPCMTPNELTHGNRAAIRIQRTPILFAGKLHLSQADTCIKCIGTDIRETVGQRNALQAFAIRESRVANVVHTLGNCDTRQACATAECIIMD